MECSEILKLYKSTRHEQWTGSKLGKEYIKALHCHPVYLTYMQSTSGEGNGTPLQYSCLKNPVAEEPGRLQSMASLRVRHDWLTSLSLSSIGEGNGNPLQCSCLENPRDGGAWWAAVYGVAQSQTQLRWLNSSSSSKVHHAKCQAG